MQPNLNADVFVSSLNLGYDWILWSSFGFIFLLICLLIIINHL